MGMGEQSVKRFAAAKWRIFSQVRNTTSQFAEVTIVLDNSDSALP